MTLTTLALTFVLSAVVIVAAGTVLARSGDVIAARTGLGGLWVGSVLLALATSLPEITTDIAAVRLGAPDLAAGDLFGSTMANMLILALISLVPAGREIFQKATLDHVLHASLAVVMTCVAAITMLVRPAVSVLRVGPASLLLVAMYAVGSRAAYRHGTLARHAAERVEMSGLAADTPEGVGPAVAPPRSGARRSRSPALRSSSWSRPRSSRAPPNVSPFSRGWGRPSSGPGSSGSRRRSLSWSRRWPPCAFGRMTSRWATCSGATR
jgi:Ca2+/H+ antiporter